MIRRLAKRPTVSMKKSWPELRTRPMSTELYISRGYNDVPGVVLFDPSRRKEIILLLGRGIGWGRVVVLVMIGHRRSVRAERGASGALIYSWSEPMIMTSLSQALTRAESSGPLPYSQWRSDISALHWLQRYGHAGRQEISSTEHISSDR